MGTKEYLNGGHFGIRCINGHIESKVRNLCTTPGAFHFKMGMAANKKTKQRFSWQTILLKDLFFTICEALKNSEN